MACLEYKNASTGRLALCSRCKTGDSCFKCGKKHTVNGCGCAFGSVCKQPEHAYLASMCFACGMPGKHTNLVSFCSDCVKESKMGTKTFTNRCCAFGASSRPVPPKPIEKKSAPVETSATSITPSNMDSYSHSGADVDETKLLLERNVKDDMEKKARYLEWIATSTDKPEVKLAWDEDKFAAVARKIRNPLGGGGTPISQILYDWYLKVIMNTICYMCEDEMKKEALLNSWTTDTIRFEFAAGPRQHNTKFRDGDLIIYFKEDDLQWPPSVLPDFEETLVHNDWPLYIALNWRDQYENQGKANLAKIEKATGKDNVTYSFDDREVYEILKKIGRGSQDAPGTLMWDYLLGSLATIIDRICEVPAKKEVLLKAWTTPFINLRFEAGPTYQNTRIEDGDIIHFCKETDLATNATDLGADLYEAADLAAKSGAASSLGIPAEAAVDLAKWQERGQEYLEMIQKATGKQPVYKFDVAAVNKALESTRYVNEVGSVMWGQRLESLAMKIRGADQDQLKKKWTTNVIRYEFEEGDWGYQCLKFEGGDIVMHSKPEHVTYNMSDCGNPLSEILRQ